MAQLRDPSPPPESSGLRAKDLKNLPILILPGEYKEETGQNGDPWKYVICEVVVLDRSGIVQRADGVRISWARTIQPLMDSQGEWLACRPVEDGNAVILEPLKDGAREVAERVLDELDG